MRDKRSLTIRASNFKKITSVKNEVHILHKTDMEPAIFELSSGGQAKDFVKELQRVLNKEDPKTFITIFAGSLGFEILGEK